MGRRLKNDVVGVSVGIRFKPSVLSDIENYAIKNGEYTDRTDYVTKIVEKDIQILKSKKKE